MSRSLWAAVGLVVLMSVACSSVGVPTEVQRVGDRMTDTVLDADNPGTCCINNLEFYDCPNGRAVSECVGLGMTACMTNCGTNADCQEGCLRTELPDPRMCTRNPARDAECRGEAEGTGGGMQETNTSE